MAYLDSWRHHSLIVTRYISNLLIPFYNTYKTSNDFGSFLTESLPLSGVGVGGGIFPNLVFNF